MAAFGDHKKNRPLGPVSRCGNYPRTRVTLLTDNVLHLRQDPGMDSERVFFVTTVTALRRPIFRRETTAKLFIETLAHYRDQRKYLLHEFEIMPDHVHLLITPAEEISLERAVQFIKGGFSFRVESRGAVWQASFTNHRIRDFEDYESHREYLWLNPVRARMVVRAEEYRWSSACGGMRLDPVPQGLRPRSSLAS
jgi:putative transposase